ncbi:glyoxylase-like metal-dependent hydrolase (beta-lactamase superfamily II) [Limimaricola variabilis]|uniref:Glyoxylase-like metal-dependent hydrolase (Beta-lactamase superfamily II) n=1 Tax=Limimaricola variabilis TaxID=1492771 RepID=A0ABR6HTG8_9RHOB|nr:MBL fold metallo-hydrolase [Limimaricola variabilis]MBB3713698.1 glyoxylase-like metal-dependent hydrolase (beta-lactamase superfamily II) [Limimaricola variabilis]
MRITRRNMLRGTAGLGASLAFGRVWAATEMDLGDLRITTLSDGHLQLPESFLIGDLPRDEARAILDAAGVAAGGYEPPCNVTLLRSGEDVVLFDAGAGPGFMDSTGRLPDALAALDLSPEDVTHVVFTHGHPDHLWGAIDDFDEPLFANARHLMGRVERDYWIDPETTETIGAERQSFAAGAARRIELLRDMLETFEEGDEVLPGVLARASFGHTPGHMSFEIGGGRALIAGDAIGNAHLAFARPDWPMPADQDPELAARTRLALLQELAERGVPLIGFHLPDGGVGRVEKGDKGYSFVPEV